MTKTRLEAFSDAVIAIVITIMVLELKVPHGDTFAALLPVWPVALAYVLSFIYIGIYWNNHHHMLHAAHRVTGGVLWANLHLMFWLSLIPVTTAWMGEAPHATAPAACYGAVLLMAAVAYVILQRSIIAVDGPDSPLQAAIGRDFKGKLSFVGYFIGIALAWVAPWLSQTLYALMALLWLIPDQRIERRLAAGE